LRREGGGAYSTNGREEECQREIDPLGQPRCRWVDNIRMDFGEIGWGGVDWTGLAQNTGEWRESSCECGNELLGSIKCC
jgi:hypothetical protein